MPDTTAAETTPPPEPEPAATPPAAPPAPASKAGRGLIAASTVVAWLAVVLFLGAVLYLAVPVSNPPVQHCGAPGLFLVHGTQDAPLQDAQGNPIHGLDQKQLQHAFDHRCSVRVADRAVPAAALGAGFVVAGVLALVLALVGHHSARRGDLDAWADAHATPEPGRAG